MPSGVGAASNRVQSEIQEVTVDMTAETGKPSGNTNLVKTAHKFLYLQFANGYDNFIEENNFK